ncbi:FadR/GntR family transcriptional regulator [Streptomyces sp. NPDC050121]|uniref:FadR/GntR family transcriptional regulator n=1 Tax=Streptomyces sp. NPDC050121 TaxID=3365601 RepID=UPI0037A1BC32
MITRSGTPRYPGPSSTTGTCALGGSLGAVPRRQTGRLSDTVVTCLVDRIVGGAFPPTSALPIEAVLCEEFAVSRTVVRESVKVLEEKGLVRAAPGSGTRVPAPPARA